MTFENALELKGELKFPDNFESFITPKQAEHSSKRIALLVIKSVKVIC
jgi:hypothetical protein